MKTVNTKISKNLYSLFGGKSLELVITFISITLVARNLGVENYGIFVSIIALTFLVSKTIDFGLAPIILREKSKSRATFNLLNTGLTLRIISFFLLVLIFNLASPYTNLSQLEIKYSNLLLINVILSAKYMNFRELLEVEFKVNHNMFFVMMFNTIDSIFFLVFVLIMPLFNVGLQYCIVTYILSNLPGFIGLILYLRKKYSYTFRFNLSQSRWLLKEALPLYGTVLLMALYQQVDILILKNFDTTYSVGIYGAATRLTAPLGIIPVVLITTVFPIIVRRRHGHSFTTDLTNSIVYKILLLFGIILPLIVSFRAKDFVLFILGQDYIDSYLPLIILFWSYLFMYFNTFSINLLTVYNLQRFNFYFTMLLVVTNISIILLLVSDFSFLGVSVAKLGASFVGTVFFIFVLKKFGFNFKFISLRIFLWLAIIVPISYALSYLPLFFYIFLVLISLIYSTLKIKFFSNEELNILFRAVNKVHWKDKLLKIV